MSEQVFDILRAAVTLVRLHQIRCIKTLRNRLAEKYPEYKEEIDEALAFWAAEARRWC